MKDVDVLFSRSSGFLIERSDDDTDNICAQFGHVYRDGRFLVASLDGWQNCPGDEQESRRRARALRKLGTVIMDGDWGELSVRFASSRFREVARIIKPRQAERVRQAA